MMFISSGAGDQLCGAGERHARSFCLSLLQPYVAPLGWTALIHASLMAAAPRDVGVTDEEGEAHPKLVLFGGNWVLRIYSPLRT